MILHMKDEGVDPYLRLQDAIEYTTPDCLDDPRYTRDKAATTSEEKKDMAAICSMCPLLTHCTAYAAAADPPAGWWPTNLIKTRKEAA